MVVLAAWCYQCPCGMCQPHDDSEAEIKSCGHLYSVQVCVCHCSDTFLIHINQGIIDFYCTISKCTEMCAFICPSVMIISFIHYTIYN